MASNHLEELIAEWYEFQGYFIRRNIKVGKRAAGGYECELDIVGFHPETKHVVHIEPSLDTASWEVREIRYQKKFNAGKKYIPTVFAGLDLPSDIEQIAVLMLASKKNRTTIGGGKIVLVPELLQDIFTALQTRDLFTNAIDEQKPLLRTLQFVVGYKDIIFSTLSRKNSSIVVTMPDGSKHE